MCSAVVRVHLGGGGAPPSAAVPRSAGWRHASAASGAGAASPPAPPRTPLPASVKGGAHTPWKNATQQNTQQNTPQKKQNLAKLQTAKKSLKTCLRRAKHFVPAVGHFVMESQPNPMFGRQEPHKYSTTLVSPEIWKAGSLSTAAMT